MCEVSSGEYGMARYCRRASQRMHGERTCTTWSCGLNANKGSQLELFFGLGFVYVDYIYRQVPSKGTEITPVARFIFLCLFYCESSLWCLFLLRLSHSPHLINIDDCDN